MSRAMCVRLLFIDLLYKWTRPQTVNIDPNMIIQVGDYGKLDSESGRFMIEGNILNLDEVKVQGVTVIQDEPSYGSQTYLVNAARHIEPNVGVSGGISGVANADTSFSFKCTKNRSAILVVQWSRRIRFQNPGVLAEIDALKKMKKEVVMEVVQSTSCYLCLSRQEGQCINVSLSITTPLAAAPIATVGGSTGIITSNDSGGCMEVTCRGTSTGEYRYTPLFLRQKLSRLQRGGEDQDLDWVDLPLPWNPLDDDGETWEDDSDSEGE